MLNTKLALTLVALLSITVTQVHGRFLEFDDTTAVISPLKANYSSSLQCGECILSGFIYCVRGPEQYSGDTPLQATCCRDKASCPQVNDRGSWNCSSKYENSFIYDKMSVCPFDRK